MPRKYKRKTDREVDEMMIKNAIRSYFTRECGLREAARRHNIKRTTLQSRIKKMRSRKSDDEIRKQLEDSGNESDEVPSNKFGNKYTVSQVFTFEEETHLRKYIQHASDLNYGLDYTQIEKLAYEYALKLPNCKIPESWHQKKKAGIEWRKGFMERNKQFLSLRKPESTSLLRNTGFNKARVDEFFTNYKLVQEKYHFNAAQIYNLDETGVTTVMKPIKVVSTKGKKQVGQVASRERGELVTFVGIISAIGNTVPPVFVYPRVMNPSKYMINPPASSLALGNKSGWMTADLFPKVLEHIVQHTKCSKEKKILLIIDNHESHTSVKSIEFCREHGIILLSFPPHTTHRLQPLDVGVYGPFKNKLAVAFNDWMLSRPGKPITIANIAELTNIAYLTSFTPLNIISSFKNTGIWPVNSLIFSESDFTPSTVTDNDISLNTALEAQKTPPNPNTENVNNIKNIFDNPQTSSTVDDDITLNTALEQLEAQKTPPNLNTGNVTNIKNIFDNPQPSTSKTFQKDVAQINQSGSNLEKRSLKIISKHSNDTTSDTSLLETIRPFPKAQREVKIRKRKRESKSKIYTDTPELNAKKSIENERENKKRVKANKTVKRNVFSKDKKLAKESSSESDISIEVADSSNGSDESFMSLKDMDPNEHIFVNDFLLVKFKKSKNDVCFYIGQVLEIDDDSYQVKFLRRKRNSTSFHFPIIDDIAMVQVNDIEARLAQPQKAGTARTQSLFRFNYNFQGMDVR